MIGLAVRPAAPLVHDRTSYDVRRMEQARLDRYQDRHAEAIALAPDPDAAEHALVRRLMYGRAVQDQVRARGVPKHRALVRLSDLPKAATRAWAASVPPR